MSKCESNVNELIVPELAGIPGTVWSRLSEYPGLARRCPCGCFRFGAAASDLEIWPGYYGD